MSEALRKALSLAHAEALRVGDSPLRADQLAARIPTLQGTAEAAALPEEIRGRVRDALATAERVLRRDDDGREAARHLQTAIGLLGLPPRRPSPFPDD